jgi:hypothetical protein
VLRFKVSASLLQGVRITSRCTAGIAREVALEGVEVGRDEAGSLVLGLGCCDSSFPVRCCGECGSPHDALQGLLAMLQWRAWSGHIVVTITLSDCILVLSTELDVDSRIATVSLQVVTFMPLLCVS